MSKATKEYKVTIDNEQHLYPAGTLFSEIAAEYGKKKNKKIALVLVNGKLQELHRHVNKDCELEFVTLKDKAGNAAYKRTAVMILLKALKDIDADKKIKRVKTEFTIGQGLYCRVFGDDVKVDDTLVTRLSIRMQQIVKDDIPITKKSYPIEEALDMFEREGMADKARLFRFRRSSTVNMYRMDDYMDYFYGYMLPSSGYVKYFDVIAYEDGILLLLPDKEVPEKINYFQPKDKLFNTLMESIKWGEMVDMDSVGDLNDRVCSGGISELILVQEAIQETRIGEIAAAIKNRGDVKFVMIAGPSSSGKTTFSHRLSIQLRSNGMKPHIIGLDDYFLNRDMCPVDENGQKDLECLESLDVAQFNQDMKDLLDGKKVELPKFNFITGKREAKGHDMQLGKEDILVIEGIHGLNDKLSASIPKNSRYKIYISALTGLNVDDHNRIATTDGRLLRRMVRDARTRGADAAKTLSMWQSVRRGEEKNIFPFQEKVDATFNSVLIYEIAVLKQYAEPLLFNIKKDEPEYQEARRLLKFLEYFLGVSSEEVPANSIVREFIGGSLFDV